MDREDGEMPVRGPRLVPEAVTTAKFEEQLASWHANREAFERRGWLLLSEGDLAVEIAIVQNVPMGGRAIPVMTVCARIDYWNFDLVPPSLTFLDPITRMPAAPVVRAVDRVSPTEVRDALIDQHPETSMPFLCLPGIREYHSHPQHTGDNWLLHRDRHEGDLVVIFDRLWRRMARNVLGMSVNLTSVNAGIPNAVANQLDVSLLQGDPDAVQRNLAGIAQQQLMAQNPLPSPVGAAPPSGSGVPDPPPDASALASLAVPTQQ